MRIERLTASCFRNIELVELELGDGVTGVVGPNGAGKTNLLEALYFGLSGRSFRTAHRRQLISFGEPLASVELELGAEGGSARRLLASVSRTEGRHHLLDGVSAEPAELARARPHVSVFSPDRLHLIKGPPAQRRAHLDQFIAARWPARATLRAQYAKALAQRNSLLARVRAGAPPAELDAWDEALARAGVPLVAARAEAAAELAVPLSSAAEDLGLGGEVSLSYASRGSDDHGAMLGELRRVRDADLNRQRTSVGPHLDELAISRSGRAIRHYGSQGEQRATLLALLFAERDALLAGCGSAPLLLLDDVMSELDRSHRALLAERLARPGQALISAVDEAALEGFDGAARVSMGGSAAPAAVAA